MRRSGVSEEVPLWSCLINQRSEKSMKEVSFRVTSTRLQWTLAWIPLKLVASNDEYDFLKILNVMDQVMEGEVRRSSRSVPPEIGCDDHKCGRSCKQCVISDYLGRRFYM